MATLTKAINKSLFDSILPTFGNPRVRIPVWDDSQKMFICDEYESRVATDTATIGASASATASSS